MSKPKPISVTLGDMQKVVDARVRSGAYPSATEVLRAGLRALEREESAVDEWMHAEIQRSLDDPRPDIPAEEVFDRLARKQVSRRKAGV
jgi:antitoxin ParD1/3/4